MTEMSPTWLSTLKAGSSLEYRFPYLFHWENNIKNEQSKSVQSKSEQTFNAEIGARKRCTEEKQSQQCDHIVTTTECEKEFIARVRSNATRVHGESLECVMFSSINSNIQPSKLNRQTSNLNRISQAQESGNANNMKPSIVKKLARANVY